MRANGHIYSSVPLRNLPWLSSEQMREVDRIAVEEFGLQILQMMENAGRALAEVAIELFNPKIALVVAGSGGNGGEGLAAARHLCNRGLDVSVCFVSPVSEMSREAAIQTGIIAAMSIGTVEEVVTTDLLIDALFGYGLNRPPEGGAKSLIEQINDSPSAVLSLDVPSGLDATTGNAPGAVVWADATLTLALPKRGLVGAEQVGELYITDVSVPPGVYEKAGIATPPVIFDRSQILRLI
ncbi:MAG: NAD(P)H-hydrate epimerase [Acidimicrobiia bacterium]